MKKSPGKKEKEKEAMQNTGDRLAGDIVDQILDKDNVFLTQGKEKGVDRSGEGGGDGDNEGGKKREIVDMLLINEEEINQLIYCDRKAFHVYGEEDEYSDHLRSVTGAHNSNIQVVAFNFHLLLIATGAEGGEVAVWDYEQS